MYSLLSFLCIFCEVYTETSFSPLLATGILELQDMVRSFAEQ